MITAAFRNNSCCRIALFGAICCSTVGCASTSLTPVRFATTRGSAEPMMLLDLLLNSLETAPFRNVQNGLGRAIGRRTQFMVLKPMQMHAHLLSGHVQFAFVDQGDEATVIADGAGRIIARPVFAEEPPTSTALFVVSKNSKLQSLSDLKGKRIAFGPPNHPALHWGALAALQSAGVGYQDLAKQLVPIPGSLQYHISSLESAKAALFAIEADVGVVDEASYSDWPESGGNVVGNLLSLSISRDQLRVIGRSEKIPLFPSGAVVASRHADPELIEKVRHYLTKVLPKKRRITKPLGLITYEAPASQDQTSRHERVESRPRRFSSLPAKD